MHQGTVLYLALEDDYARLQHRLSRMFGVEEAASLYFATQAKTLSEGLDQQLEHFIREHPDVRLIIIDTLQKVREVGGDRYSYASDYEIVTKLKAFSDKYGICLLVVHHLRQRIEMLQEENTRLKAVEHNFGRVWSYYGAEQVKRVVELMAGRERAAQNVQRQKREHENVI